MHSITEMEGAAENEDVKLLSCFASPFGMRVIMALQLKGIRYEIIEVDLFQKPQILLDANPVHKRIPVLIHNGKPICESLGILEYIVETWPSQDGTDLLPKDPYDRAVARFWANFVDTQVSSAGYKIIDEFGESQEKAIAHIKKSLETVEGALKKINQEGKGPFFGGKQLSIADITLAPFVIAKDTYELVGNFKFSDAEQWPNFHKWMEALKTSDVAAALADPDAVKQFLIYVYNLVREHK